MVIVRIIRQILILLLMVLGSYGCAAKKKAVTSKIHEVKLYNPASNEIHPALKIFHFKDNTSLLYLSFITSEFLFNQANEKGEYLAQAQIIYELTELGEKKDEAPESDTFKMEIKLDKANNKYLATIPLNIKQGKRYFLRIHTFDKNSEKNGQSFLYIDKTSENTSQNFLVISDDINFPLFREVMQTEEKFRVQHRKYKTGTLFVSYYKNEQPMPLPTFALTGAPAIELRRDSLWAYNYSDTILFHLPYKGKYLFQFDTTGYEGLTLYNFGPYFPKFMTADDMVPPLAYLTTSMDYKKLMETKNKKLALDDYWYTLAGNMDVARELIRIYYNRAHFANYYFTCDRDGWKTDRGMIYIIYGLPDKVLKDTRSEKWQYFDKQNTVTISFTFTKRDNPFTENDFELVREEAYDSHWRRAVETWRAGKVFIIE